MKILRPVRALLCLGLVLSACSAWAADPDAGELASLRARRRAAMRSVVLDPGKSGEPVLFGLLVIPVDFADTRLPGNWDAKGLTDRLTGQAGESLVHYYDTASRGKLELRITQTPVIHLPGTRRDYSDVGLNGFYRTRALAGESLQAVKEMGLEFRRLDMEGPDRIPGTDDDDGEVDGVLILHAGIGQENDAELGLVQALQFFLAEPVVSDGISATFYAVASLHSGPGIWAHETGHLLGLEDRYDPGLRPRGGSELESRGGLGRFSLMASGAWGTGDGYGAALPDAYSCLQLGWYRTRNLANSGTVPDTLESGVVSGLADRLWTRGEGGPEFFLLEVRDPAAAYPFDADVPGDNLLIYHIDETLPEGGRAADGPDTWHLRATMVEADDDGMLLRGEDHGRAEDLFPGPLGKTDFGPDTVPSSLGYHGKSGVSLAGITSRPGQVVYRATVWPEKNLEFTVGFSGRDPVVLDLAARSSGVPFSSLTCRVEAGSPSWGNFADGSSFAVFEMEADGQGVWGPAEPVVWFPAADTPLDGHTVFTYNFQYDGDTASEARTWYWKDNGSVLDFASFWPGSWTIAFPSGVTNTTWHVWSGEPWLTQDKSPVLACTGYLFDDSSVWPDVTYGNSAFTTLTSGQLGPDVRAVRLIHSLEVELLTAGVAMDGARTVWVDPMGREVPAEPLAGWPGRISDKAVNELHGQDAFIQEQLEVEGAIPLWRTDIIPMPEQGNGPWRLRLCFGSNSLWRHQGWFVARLDPIRTDPASARFTACWDCGSAGGLTWTWPWDDGGPRRFIVQRRESPAGRWQNIADELFSVPAGHPGYLMPADRILPLLEGPALGRHELRVIGFIDQGKVVTAGVIVYPDGGDGRTCTLGLPWPNPAPCSVRIMADVPPGSRGTLGVFDLGGRRIWSMTVGAGRHLLEWDGRDGKGGLAASGTYFIRLEGSGPVVTRKVVLVH